MGKINETKKIILMITIINNNLLRNFLNIAMTVQNLYHIRSTL